MNDKSRKDVQLAFGTGVDTLQVEIEKYLYPLYKQVKVARVNGELHITILVGKNPILGYPVIALVRIFTRLNEVFKFSIEDNTPEGSTDSLITVAIKSKRS